ncbi:glycosyltransferase family 2 protein [Bacteroides fragilis]
MNNQYNPLISIIIPVYNVGHYLNKCLSSCLEQTYTCLEIICVDDGSTDDSYMLLKKKCINRWSNKDSETRKCRCCSSKK